MARCQRAAGGAVAHAYPLDGYPETGIRRLEGMRLANEGKVADVKQPHGAMLPLKAVDLRLVGRRSTFRRPTPSSTAQVTGILGGSLDGYGLAVLDLTDPAKPRYAEHHGDLPAERRQRRQARRGARAVPGARRRLPERHRGAQRVLKSTRW